MLALSEIRDGKESSIGCFGGEQGRKDGHHRAADLWKPRGWSGERNFLSFPFSSVG